MYFLKKKTYPTFTPSLPSTDLTHLKPTFSEATVLCSMTICLRIMAKIALFLITSKGSFLFRKQKFTAKHTASIHKVIYGTDN